MAIYIDRKCDEISRSEWFISASNNFEALHWYLKRKSKGAKLIFGSGKIRRKFNKITDLYYANNIKGITDIKDNLISKNCVSDVRYKKKEELISYCIFLEEFDRLDLAASKQLSEDLIAGLDTRYEIGRLIQQKVEAMNAEKQKSLMRKSQSWLNRRASIRNLTAPG